jgi:hypothetical protein
MLGSGLKYIWETRIERKQVRTFKKRSEVKAKISILRRARFKGSGDIMWDVMNE